MASQASTLSARPPLAATTAACHSCGLPAETASSYLSEAPSQRRWSRLDDLLWARASEAWADATAWTRLFELLAAVMDDEVVARHPEALAALVEFAAAARRAAGRALILAGPVAAEIEPLQRHRAQAQKAARRRCWAARVPRSRWMPTSRTRSCRA